MRAVWLGRLGYAEALSLQEKLVIERQRGDIPDTLLLLEHPPVVTLGRSAGAGHVLMSPDELSNRGIELFEVGRGGDATYHGPGQVVGYPVVGLVGGRRDARAYLRSLEEVLIRTAGEFGVKAEREEGLTGAWVNGRKIGAIGVRISTGWITSHGFALNVSCDLQGFDAIVPCGIRDRQVTSLLEETGISHPVRSVAIAAAGQFAASLDMTWDGSVAEGGRWQDPEPTGYPPRHE